jgi:hypothetical protein
MKELVCIAAAGWKQRHAGATAAAKSKAVGNHSHSIHIASGSKANFSAVNQDKRNYAAPKAASNHCRACTE